VPVKFTKICSFLSLQDMSCYSLGHHSGFPKEISQITVYNQE